MEYKVKITKAEYIEADSLLKDLRKDYEGKALVKVMAIVDTDMCRYRTCKFFVAEAPERMGEWRKKNPDKSVKDLQKMRKEVRDREVRKAKEIMKSVMEGIEPPYRTNTKTAEDYFYELRTAFETDRNGVVVGTKAA